MGRLNRNTSGSVLILSLWILALLSLLAYSLSYQTRIELLLSRYPWDEVRLSEAARLTALQSTLLWQNSHVSYTALDPSWNTNPDVTAEDDSAKLNLNKISLESLQRLLGTNAEAALAIVDWRSPQGGRENYSGLGYVSRQGPFRSVEELRLVKGITPEIYQDIAGYLTVYSETVNLNTAPARVLDALGLKAVLVNKILLFRAGADGQEGTADDGVFTHLESVIPMLQQRLFLSEEDVRVLTALLRSRRVGVQSNTVRLAVQAHVNDVRGSRLFKIIVAARSLPVRIVYWREAAP